MTSPKSILRGLSLAAALPALATLAALSLGCAMTQTMRSGAGVPASEGTVSATSESNGNTKVAVRVKHLAPPSKVAADATVYVVWVQPRNARPQNVGALTLNDNLEGSLDTTTPHHQFRLTVTPEPSGQVDLPTHEAVFTSNVDQPR